MLGCLLQPGDLHKKGTNERVNEQTCNKIIKYYLNFFMFECCCRYYCCCCWCYCSFSSSNRYKYSAIQIKEHLLTLGRSLWRRRCTSFTRRKGRIAVIVLLPYLHPFSVSLPPCAYELQFNYITKWNVFVQTIYTPLCHSNFDFFLIFHFPILFFLSLSSCQIFFVLSGVIGAELCVCIE